MAVEDDFGLFEVAASVLVNEDETEVVAGGVFLVDFAEGGGQVEAAEEEADGDCFACGWLARVQLIHAPRLEAKGQGDKNIPLDGLPSIISNLTNVSLSLY